jgi:hypothetical protein
MKRWAGNVTCKRKKRNAYRFLVGKPEGERPFRRPRHRWESDIEVDIREIECNRMD